ncbi:hypothetical protein [Micromonospora sp. RP3T]|uniref:hypothetical protein n=1 Tax=Micromonospora sp. RP3T TaxID=2135446 RepID=UPI000D16F165|nr:hypothetical protein [Micromonospora sp. RP3T]PTA44530.1 hypothetical protein C8054_19745 [Micromonospora sp. RP3T]
MLNDSGVVVDGEYWTLPLPDLWREFAYDNHLLSLEEILAGVERAQVGSDPFLASYSVEPVQDRCGPLVWFETETYAAYVNCFELGGADDPLVWACSRTSTAESGLGWGRDGESFSGWLLDWFASFYHERDLPLSFEGPDADWESLEQWPMQPYRNGLWATAIDQPASAVVIAELTARYGQPSRRSLAGGAASYRWQPHECVLTVTTDPPDGSVSAWWLHGDTHEAFAELLRSVWRYGTLPSTLTHSRSCVNRAEADRVIEDVFQGRRVAGPMIRSLLRHAGEVGGAVSELDQG